jgi:hypothetical protein
MGGCCFAYREQWRWSSIHFCLNDVPLIVFEPRRLETAPATCTASSPASPAPASPRGHARSLRLN